MSKQLTYLQALCRILNEPFDKEKLYQSTDQFYAIVQKSLLGYIKQQTSENYCYANDLFDMAFDKFLLQLGDRPKAAERIFALVPSLAPPIARGENFVISAVVWGKAIAEWTEISMSFCACEDNFSSKDSPESKAQAINKALKELRKQGDDELLAWIGWEQSAQTSWQDQTDDVDYEDIDEAQEPSSFKRKPKKTKRNQIESRIKALAALLQNEGVEAADREIGVELGARFAIDSDEIIRDSGKVGIYLESYLKQCAKWVIESHRRKLDQDPDITSIDSDEDKTDTPKHAGLKLMGKLDIELPEQTEETALQLDLSELEIDQSISTWIVSAKEHYGMSQQQADEYEKLLQAATQKIMSAQKEQNSNKPTNAQRIEAQLQAPLHEAYASFNYYLSLWQNAELLPKRAFNDLVKDLRTSFYELQKEQDRYVINTKIIALYNEGIAERPDSKKGYSEQELAEKAGLKNRDAVITCKNDIAMLLAPQFPQEARHKAIKSLMDYIKSKKREVGDQLPLLPTELDDDNWKSVLLGFLNLLNQEYKNLAEAKAMMELTMENAEQTLVAICLFNQAEPTALKEFRQNLANLLQNRSELSERAFAKMYAVPLATLQSLLSRQIAEVEAITTLAREITITKRRQKEVLDALRHFK